MPRNSTWVNSDGLTVGYGTHSEDDNVAAVVSERGPYKVMQMYITATNLVATASVADTDQPPQAVTIKRGSHIKSAKLSVVVPFATSASGTLTIGTFAAGDASTVDDVDGIDATIAVTAIDAIGDVVVCDGALVNGVVPLGATSNSDVVILPSYGTGVFTAGQAILTVEYAEPDYGQTVAA
jgi:hypothetical protein